MPLYKCELCGISTTLKSNYIRHLNTMKHIKKYNEATAFLKKKNKIPSNEPKNEDFEPQIPHFCATKKNKEYKCNICCKTFSRKDNLKRHMMGCTNITKNNENINYKELFLIMKNQYESDKKEFKKQIEILLGKVGNTTNTTINNTQNIQLNSYGKEDLSHITEMLKTELLKIPYAMIPKLIKEVHFNDTKPENKNIYLPNKKDNLIKIYKNKEETLNDLVDGKYFILDTFYEDQNDVLNDNTKMKYKKFRSFYDEKNKKLLDKIKNDSELILLNNR